MKDPTENPTIEKHGFEILRMSLTRMQVCSPLSEDKIEEAVNQYFPSGTANGWTLLRKGIDAPVTCADISANTHYLLTC